LKFNCRYGVADGAKEIFKALKEGIISYAPWTKVIDWWKKLQDEGIVRPLGGVKI
jgi:hypothetical protein